MGPASQQRLLTNHLKTDGMLCLILSTVSWIHSSDGIKAGNLVIYQMIYLNGEFEFGEIFCNLLRRGGVDERWQRTPVHAFLSKLSNLAIRGRNSHAVKTTDDETINVLLTHPRTLIMLGITPTQVELTRLIFSVAQPPTHPMLFGMHPQVNLAHIRAGCQTVHKTKIRMEQS